jgi:hypothetical protein
LKAYAISTPRGNFYDVNPDRAAVLTELIATIRGPSLVVVPEGATINYFTSRPSPLSYYMFTPPETGSPQVEQSVLAEMRRSAPDQIVFVSRDVSEYGSRGFGIDYDREIASYVSENYELTKQWRRARFEAALLSRRR